MKIILRNLKFTGILLFILLFSGVSNHSISQTPAKLGSFTDIPKQDLSIDALKLNNIAKVLSDKLGSYIISDYSRNRKFSGQSMLTVSQPQISKLPVITKNTANINLSVIKNETNGTPRFITGEGLKQQLKHGDAIQSTAIALNYINDNKDLFRLDDPVNELILKKDIPDIEGNHHLVYEQQYMNVPVWGKEMTVHTNKDNQIFLINSAYVPTPNILDLNISKISPDHALQIAKDNLTSFRTIEKINPDLQKMMKYSEPVPKEYIYINESDNKPVLTYMLEIRPNIAECWRYFINASTGEIIEKYNASPTDGPATANAADLHGNTRKINVYQQSGTYYMADASRQMYDNSDAQKPKGEIITYNNNNTDLTNQSNPLPFSSQNNTWSDPSSVSVHYNMGLTYEYYRQTHNRNSLDNAGMTIFSIIHVTNNGQSFDNAYWNGAFVVMGDGGQYCKPWPGSLDLLAHEMTHGVITFTVDLEYKTQSGALNEAFADWGGAMVDRGNWKIGEEIAKTSFFPTGCVRDMENPHNGGTPGDLMIYLPEIMSEYYTLGLDQDNGGVHVNCGIINKATFLIGNAITKDKLEKIYYRLLNNHYISKQSQFIDLRLAAVKSAQELYGDNSTEVNAVKSAFDQVGITGSDGTKETPDLPSVQGQQYVACVSSADLSLYMAKSVVQDPNNDIKHLTATQLFVNSGSVITVPDNGTVVIFINAQNNLKAIKSDGTNETYLDQEGIWRSISISPDGRYLATTLINEKPILYIFDLLNNTYQADTLYIPTTSQTSYTEAPYAADVMTWNVNGKILGYDALNYKISTSGDFSGFWDMNLLDVSSGIIYRVFPPLDQGLNLVKPSFSQTSENIITFEVVNENDNTYTVVAANLFTGEANPIAQSNGQTSIIMNPCYSSDDSKIVYQVYTNSDGKYYLYKSNIDNTKIKPTADDPSEYLSNAALPRWFAIGTRPVSVDEQISNKSSLKIYPNPANRTINVEYSLNKPGNANVALYNTLSQQVTELISVQPNETGSGYLSIDSSRLPNGMYFLIMRPSDGSIMTQCVVVAR